MAWEVAAVVQELIQQFGRGGESILVVLPGLEAIFRSWDHLQWKLPLTEDLAAAGGEEDDTSEVPAESSEANATGAAEAAGGGSRASGAGVPERLYFEAFTLPSSISIEEQERACRGNISKDFCRIYLASNLAEKSLTLPKVRVVIDSGLHRQCEHDALRRTSALETRWVSRASVEQRAGRTGRVFAGVSVRLFPRAFYEQCMREFERPVIHVAPLEKTMLMVMALVAQNVLFSALRRSASSTSQSPQHLSAKTLLEALPFPP